MTLVEELVEYLRPLVLYELGRQAALEECRRGAIAEETMRDLAVKADAALDYLEQLEFAWYDVVP